MNQKLFAKIAEVINTKPGEFDMHSWEAPSPSCGTTRCVAGWAVHFETGQPLYGRDGADHPSVLALASRLDVSSDPGVLGAELLGLNRRDAELLFFAEKERARQVVDLFAHGYEAEAIDLLWSEE